MIAFPRRHLPALGTIARETLERRGAEGSPKTLARNLLEAFYETCTLLGLDGVLHEIGKGFDLQDVSDASMLSEEPRLHGDLVARLNDPKSYDPGGPRAGLAGQLVRCLRATLSLSPTDTPARPLCLSDAVRVQFVEALSGPVQKALAVPKIRLAIIEEARAICDLRYIDAFVTITAGLDKRGLQFPPQPTLPIHVVQSVRRDLEAARKMVVERAARSAIERATRVLASASTEAANRIEQPISYRLTPRDVALMRLEQLRFPAPEAVVESLRDSLASLAELEWEAPELSGRPYQIRAEFAVGEHVAHPKFGIGTVQAASETSIEVEFDDGEWRTLAHRRN